MNLGILLLGVLLIVIGLGIILHLNIPNQDLALGVFLLVAGILLIVGR